VVIAASQNLTIGSANNNLSSTFSGVISGGTSASTALTKDGAGVLTLSGNNTYAGNTIINFGVLNIQSANALGAAGAGNTTTINQNRAMQIQSVSGFTTAAEALTINGGMGISNDGALRNITGDNNYSGAISLATAPVRINSDAGTLTLSGGISGAQDLTFGGAGNVTVNSLIATGTAALTKDGLGTLTLNGSAVNTFSGVTTVNGGTMVLDLANRAANDVINPAILPTLGGGNWKVKGKAGAALTQTLGNLTLTATTASTITVDSTGATSVTLILGNNWTQGGGATLLIDYTSANSSSFVKTLGAITGSSSIGTYVTVKDSTGIGPATRESGTGNIIRDTSATILTINSNGSAVNYTTKGSTYVSGNSGTLTWTDNGALGNRSVNSLTIDTSTEYGTITMGAAGNILTITAGAITFGGANNEILTGGQVVSAAANVVTVHQSGTGTFTINSLISSGSTVYKDGTGTLVLGGNSTFTGWTYIQGGILKLGAAGDGVNSPLGTIATGTWVVSGGGGALDLNGITLSTAEPLTLNGTGVSNGGALMNSSATAATFSGLITLGSATTIAANSGNIVLSNIGIISGTWPLTLDGTSTGSSIASIIGTTSGTLTKNGAGTWTLSGANTYTGITTINLGTLSVMALANGGVGCGIGAAANAAANLVLNGGTLQLSGAASAQSTDRLFTLGATATAGALDSATATAGNTMTFASTGAIAFTGAGARTLTLRGSNTGNNLFAPLLGDNSGAEATALTKAGTGTWLVSGANTFSGQMTVQAGTLSVASVNNASAAGPLGQSALSVILGSTGVTGTLQYTGGGTPTTSKAFTMATGGTGGFQVDGSGTVLTLSAAIAASTGGLTKTGAGTLKLSAAAGYTGATTVSAGTLALGSSGALDSGSSVSISAGAMLDVSAKSTPYTWGASSSLTASGTGTAVGTTAAAIKGPLGGTVDLGTRPITLTYDGVNPALYISQGTLSLSGNAFVVNKAVPLAPATYAIVRQASGTVTHSGTYTVTGTAIPSGMSGVIEFSGTDVNLVVKTAVDATRSTFTPGTASIAAGGFTQVLTVQAKDGSDNNVVVGGATVVISRQSGSGTVGSTTDNGNGTYTATVTSPMATGSGTFVATLNAVGVGTAVGASSSVVTYVPGAANAEHSAISPLSAIKAPDGASTLLITVQVRDAYDHNLTSGGGAVAFSATEGGMSAVTDAGNGTYTATWTAPNSPAPVSAIVTATLNGTPVGTAVGASSCVISMFRGTVIEFM
jgi:autotransporter-associated beta strand protein